MDGDCGQTAIGLGFEEFQERVDGMFVKGGGCRSHGGLLFLHPGGQKLAGAGVWHGPRQ